MTLCCDFLALRLALCGKEKEGYDFAAKRAALLQKHDGVQVHLLESIAAYFYALQGRPEQAPELFREHKLAEVSFFGPCRPMMSLIEQQVWLAQGEYVKVIAHSEGLLRRCEAMHYGLVGLQARTSWRRAQLRFGQRPRPGPRWQRLCWTLCRTISGCSLWSSIPLWPPCWKERTGPPASRAWGPSWPLRRRPGFACRPGLPAPRRSCPDRPRRELAVWWPGGAPTRRSPPPSTSPKAR